MSTGNDIYIHNPTRTGGPHVARLLRAAVLAVAFLPPAVTMPGFEVGPTICRGEIVGGSSLLNHPEDKRKRGGYRSFPQLAYTSRRVRLPPCRGSAARLHDR
jgi:hypothetical protein